MQFIGSACAIDWSAFTSLYAAASSALVGLSQAAVAAIVAWVGWQGLDTWKRENNHKRNQELAEEILFAAYRVDEAVKYLRTPFKTSAELNKTERGANESEAAYSSRAFYSVVSHRYRENEDRFNELRLLRFRAAARFGIEYRKLLEDLLLVGTDVVTSSQNAFRFAKQWHDLGVLVEHSNTRDLALTNQHREEDIMTWASDTDPTSLRLGRCLIAIEQAFRPYVKG